MTGDFRDLLTALMDKKRPEGVCVDLAKAKIDATTLHELLKTGSIINFCGWAKASWIFLLNFHHFNQHCHILILPHL